MRIAIASAVLVAVAAAAWFARTPAMRLLARHHLSRAEKMLAAADPTGAASELTAALGADPLQGRARLLLGELYLRRSDVERAFLELQAYTDAFPDDADGWADLAQVRLLASQPLQAEAAIERAVGCSPGRADLRLRRAELRYRTGHFHGALVDAQRIGSKAIARDAEARLAAADCAPAKFEPVAVDAAAWPGTLGETIREFLAATHGRNWSAASALVSRARSEFPGTMLGPWLDGLASLRMGDLDHAEESFRLALAVAPRSHRPLGNLIALWSHQHGPAYSADQLVRIVDGDPQFTYPLPIAAAAYLEDSRPSKAEATIRRMFVALPSSPLPFREVARFFLQLDRTSDAIATATQGLQRFPGDAELLREQALGYLKLGDREAALASWEAALAAQPDDETATAQIAKLLVRASKARALQLVRALECDAPSDPEVLGAMGTVLLEVGDARRARLWLEAARDRAPESPQLRYQLALAYARGQDAADARRELQEALRTGQAFEDEPEARRLLRDLEGP